MNGAARPLFAWVLLLVLFGVIDAVWTGSLIQIGVVAAATVSILVLIAVVVAPGPRPPADGRPAPRRREVIVTASAGAAGTGVGLGALVYGLVFGRFLILLGGIFLLASLGRLMGEWRAQRAATR